MRGRPPGMAARRRRVSIRTAWRMGRASRSLRSGIWGLVEEEMSILGERDRSSFRSDF